MILELIAGLSDPSDRYKRSLLIARHFGGSYFIIFVKDTVINEFLPASGFPQTLPNGFVWRAFLERSASNDFYTEELPFPIADEPLRATAIASGKNSVAVVLGGAPTLAEIRPIQMLMPLLVALFQQEQATIAAQTVAEVAERSVVKAEKLTHTIDVIRLQLKEALVKQERDKRAIEELMQRKDEFINIASHELKTPVASMKAYIQVLARQLGPDLGTASGFIQRANKQADKLTGLVNDLLDVNKIQAGYILFNFTEFDFMDIMHQELEQFQIVNPEYQFIIKGAQQAVITADKHRLEQVVSNLISNAIKYSPDGEQIIVNLILNDDHLRVEVTDFGIGIPEEDVPYLFDRFYRVRSIVPRFSGLGLGLYISAEIVKRHGGEIGVCTQPDRGSTFWFSVPRNSVTTP